MKQRKQTLHADNLGDVMGAAKNAAMLGTNQFETPLPMARALMLPLTAYRSTICDLTCGHGHLLAAASNESTQHVLGLDIDPTATALPRGVEVLSKPAGHVMHGDLNKVVPLLRELQWKADLIVSNPPFSLKWPDGDSTLVAWNLANEFLTAHGEGMFLCNGPTAKRLLADTKFSHRIWLWVTVPGFFPGVRLDEVAVIYFAADHAVEHGTWIDFKLPTADPALAAQALKQFGSTVNRKKWINGSTVSRVWDANADTATKWKATGDEWKLRTATAKAARNGWNIRQLADGTLDVWLTPFQQMSASVPRDLAEELQSLHGRHPTALVVQKASRMALQRAVNGNLWRVEPAVTAAVKNAVDEYNSVRAPFSRLSSVMRLAYLDEEDRISCAAPMPGFTQGLSYAMETQTFEGRKVETRKRPAEADEEVLVSGMELAILITDDTGDIHCFTQFPPHTADTDRPHAEHHHLLSVLVEHFVIPEVPDVTSLNPVLFQTYKDRLRELEAA